MLKAGCEADTLYLQIMNALGPTEPGEDEDV
jgi:hypothetical protein